MDGLIIPGVVKCGPLILPTADDVEKYGPPNPSADDFLSENEKGLPIVRKPVGLRSC